MELDAFDAVQEGRRQDAIDALFSVDYLRAKHLIMQPIDELMIRVRQRIAAEREAWLLEAERLPALVIWAAVLAAAANLMLLLVARRRYARAEADRRDRAAPEVPVDS